MTGTLKVKNGIYYAVINYKDDFGKYKQKWISTGLKERGNKKQAQRFLNEQLQNFNPNEIKEQVIVPIVENDLIFVDYIKSYIENKQKELAPEVYQSYMHCWKVLNKFFGNKLKLKDVTYKHIKKYYDYLKNERGNKNVTIKHHAVILSPALRLAYRDDLIPKNPYEFMPKLKREKSMKKYYNKEELEKLFKITDETDLSLIVRVASFYGFRRSELLGLKWNAIDFEKKTITIQHKIVCVEKVVYCSDTLKTMASNRTLPLIPEIEKLLLERKAEIEKNKFLYGMCYNKDYLDYIFVDDIGSIILPDYVSHKFSKILNKHNLKHIRFHDLRHSCASLLVANGVPMKNIQEWLGHANFGTTADVYSHLDFSAKEQSASVISNALSFNEEETVDTEIEELERQLEEKRRKKKLKDFEM